MRLTTIQGFPTLLLAASGSAVQPQTTTSKELAVTHSAPTPYLANVVATAKEENAAHAGRFLFAAALLVAGFYFLDR